MHVPSALASAALLLLAQVNTASATPVPDTAATSSYGSCSSPLVRKEWRTLSSKDKLAFINALKCMQSKPSQAQSLWAGAQNRYDDYQGLHISQTDFVHFCAQFLPWHRYLLYLFETDLRSTCSYTGTIPYWDWTKDATSEGAFLNSPVFDATYGFGGNGPYIADISNFTEVLATTLPGRTGGGCVSTGPFANVPVNMGPGNHTEYTPHCLRRDFVPSLITQTVNSSVVAATLQVNTFFDLDHIIQGLSLEIPGMRTHAGGHLGVGGMVGEMSNMYSSPGDPLFWLHHANLDRIWNTWQRASWPARKTAIGGPDTMWAYPYNFFGDIPYNNITLQTPLKYTGVASTITVSTTMDIQGGPFCYSYA
ncbi:hypothetical protein QBC46DRAFT_359102 [Diplogelasinospora grovesii]|uniref:Tyrosinase copper-binding domain-containing protein n=1 Tax=Diplogelasinospora grovesii TaxID=303347 RepID=A0AAN6MVM5_9PEZI|nr:hypothetical protein QBC46DRAFT_359102 [Diplogelasinospora grovesii]